MMQAVRREGLLAPLFFIFAGALIHTSALAQSASQAELQRCAALSDSADKLACFEALVIPETAQADDAEDPQPTVAEEPSQPDGEKAAVAAAAVLAVPAPEADPEPAVAETQPEPAVAESRPEPAVADTQPESTVTDSEPGPAIAESQPGTPVESPATAEQAQGAEEMPTEVAAAAAIATVADEEQESGSIVAEDEVADDMAVATAEPVVAEMPDDLGAKYIETDSDDDEPEVYLATIQSVTGSINKPLTFNFANGQVWRQRDKGYFYYPKNEPFEVEIRRGMMGDYQIRVGGEGRMTRIVRVR